ncbi:MAG: YbaB/EbfC family nucleoid-associated protein [Pseudomonadota bacterium]
MMKGPLAGLLQQAQKMKEDMERSQEALAQQEVTGGSGGGLVEVVMTGRHEVRRVRIDPSLLKDDADMLEDLVAAAVNDATNKVAAMQKEQMGELAGGLNLPAGFKLPF